MPIRSLWIIVALLLSSAAEAQHGAGPSQSRTPPREAAQFNFLAGQWELIVKPAPTSLGQRIHGVPKLVGTWKGWRALDGWGFEDELRITDNSGNPVMLSHAVRYYDAGAKQWKSSTVDVYRGVFTNATAQMSGSSIVTSSSGVDQEGKSYLSKSTYSAITPGSFKFVQQRSIDGGKTWKENLTIEAKRVSATASR